MIDTLMYVKKLEAAGSPRNHAELQVEIMADFVDKNYATKQDFKDLELKMAHQFARLEDRLTIKMGAMLVAAVGLIVTLQKLL